MLKLRVPEGSNEIPRVSLGGYTYGFYFYVNSVDNTFRFDILLGDTPVIRGVKTVQSVNLLERYDLPDFDHGLLVIIKVKETDEDLCRNNLGIGKPFELIYISNEELE